MADCSDRSRARIFTSATEGRVRTLVGFCAGWTDI